ncbi:MAG: inorganic phosphate transporter [Armatimonadetes bacterium]|nr:inorganic phosphate transporter [Armatimonadota bacterium]
MLTLVVFIIIVALSFDFINGFHDAANSIATVVATRVLTPQQAVVWAAFFNFVAAFGFGVKVAGTIGKGVIDPSAVNEIVLLSGLIGAIVWDLITWYFGLPTSSSHALIGGFLGAAVTRAGWQAVILSGIGKICLFIVLSPLIGMLLGFAFMVGLYHLLQHASPYHVDRHFRRLQLVSAALYSLGHGTNDAQKTMGIIAVLLFTAGYLGSEFYVPFWVVLICHAAIAAGTMAGGWRIVHTMGHRITKLKPIGGFCAESAGAISILFATHLGIPVSTTHTITGAIVGVGSTRRLSAVKWGVVGQIVWAWILTIPASALIAAIVYTVIGVF